METTMVWYILHVYYSVIRWFHLLTIFSMVIPNKCNLVLYVVECKLESLTCLFNKIIIVLGSCFVGENMFGAGALSKSDSLLKLQKL